MIAADAIAGGFDEIVIVINRDTGPTIQAHVARFWPDDHRVSFAFQDKLRGTVDAVLTAEPLIDPATPFAVSNADDLYGRDAFESLCAHLTSHSTNCLVAYELENSLVGDLPVSRGSCEIVDGRLVKIVERRNVHFTPEGLAADDDLSPYYLDPSTRVSMNLWGFQPAVWPLMHTAMAAYRDGDPEVLLPTFVADAMANHGMVVDALLTSSRCIGVTHAEDLPLAQFLVREEIKSGQRPEYAFPPRV